jgi:hypothetical protein
VRGKSKAGKPEMLDWLARERRCVRSSFKEWTGTRWVLRDRNALWELSVIDALRDLVRARTAKRSAAK